MLGAIKWYWSALAVVFIVISILLIFIVLLQKGRGGGLSAAFGGMGGQSAFGSKTGDYFTWVTVGVVAVFLLLAMVLTMNYEPTTELDAIPAPSIAAPEGTVPVAPEAPAATTTAPEAAPVATPEASETAPAAPKPMSPPTSESTAEKAAGEKP